MCSIAERKKEIRRELSSLRNSLSEEFRSPSDRLIIERVLNSDAYINSNIILAYYPIKSEPQILPIISQALSDSKQVALPISNTGDYTLTFRYISSLSELCEGAYSIKEPPKNAPEYKGESGALCIVPALAFDKKGMRIGYGKGFYDRFLSGFCGITMGLCYSELLVASLPCENTDVPIEIIITEKEEINLSAK